VEYKGHRTTVKIVCKTHGIFEQLPIVHFRGGNCPKCVNISSIGFSKSAWINFCNNKLNADPKVYIINCFNKEESFIKIGITSGLVSCRFKDSILMPYSYKVIKEIKGSPDFVFSEEKRLHKIFKSYKYTPKKNFTGKNECFTLNILNNKMFN
jgi:hypothetical protein